MRSKLNTNNIYIKVNDIFDELNEENKRLNNELMFANNCLKVFNKLKIFLDKICLKFEAIIESEDKQELNQLREEFNSVIKYKDINNEEKNSINKTINKSLFELKVNKTKQKLNKNIIKEKKSHKIKKSKNCLEDSDYELSDNQLNDSSDEVTNHKKTNDNKKLFCNYNGCKLVFSYESQRRAHIERRHTFVKRYKCVECDQQFRDNYQLKDHKTIHSGITFECKECHKVFPRKILFNAHQRTHSKDARIYCCDLCDFQTKYSSYYKFHKRRKHEITERTVECDVEDCHKKFKDIPAMRLHKKTVHRIERFMCDWPGCGQTYKTKTICENHKKTHIGIREYKCDFEGCGKDFLTSKGLHQHKMYHTKAFLCLWPECGLRFGSKYKLSEHMNRHQNIKPFKCPFDGCPKEYFNHLSLRFHRLTIHKNQRIDN